MHMLFLEYGVLRAMMHSKQLISEGSFEPAHMHNLVSYSDTLKQMKICGQFAYCVRLAVR